MWRWSPNQMLMNFAVNFGPRGLANNNPLEFADKRYEARGNYFYLRFDASFIRDLPLGMQALLRVAGQYAPEPLISNEGYSIGGIDGVRGYLEAEELGDSAIKGTVQLRSPQLGRWDRARLTDLYVFFDAGAISTSDPLPGQLANSQLRSVGAGLDLLPGAAVVGSLVVARPLLTGIETQSGYWRLLFSVHGSF
jgi:hemolysin activation/secretion protein